MIQGLIIKLRRHVLTFPFISALIIGFFIGWLTAKDLYINDENKEFKEIRQSGYRFINPLLECEMARDTIETRELLPFKYKVEKLVEEKISAGKAKHISIYFRDMHNGPWFGINEKQEFSPASMLKVPLMIAALKLAEEKPDFLLKKIMYDGSFDYNAQENIRPSVVMKAKNSYSIDELIYRMIVYSDNNAAELILKNIPEKLYYKVYRDLGLEIPGIRKIDDYMSVKKFASFFRVLFNASYLSREMSEKALEYLVNADYNGGIVSGVPAGILVAQKFGERKIVNSNNPDIVEQIQLHDCGIVYHPRYPYLLCIMTRGNDFDALAENIKDISRLVYEEIDQQVLLFESDK